MDDLTYRPGPPPEEGWWPTQNLPAEDVPVGLQEYRFWHGTHWSVSANSDCCEVHAAMVKYLPACFTDDEIQWRGWTDAERQGQVEEIPNADLF